MKHVFIVNPISGKADASGTLVPQIIQVATKRKLDYQIILTEYHRHAIELAKAAAESGEPVRLYACGGDGTLNQVVQGAYQYPNAEITCVPCGSGNDFVRNFGGRAAFLDLEKLIDGESLPIDLIKTPQGVAVAICSAGLDAQVAYGIPKFRRLPFCGGSMAYNLSIVQCVCGKMGHKLRILADGKEITGEYLMVAACNGTTYGGGYVAAPQADLTDGLLDLVLVEKISRLRAVSVIGIYKSGKHLENGKVVESLQDIISYKRVKQLSIQTLDDRPITLNKDGECAPCNEVSLFVLSKAVRFVLPKGTSYTPER